MTSAAPTNKFDFYRRYLVGEFGNRPKSWANYEELMSSGWKGDLISCRNFKVVGGLVCLANTLDEIRYKNGGSFDDLTFVEPVPHYLNLIQGEICRNLGPLEMSYSTRLNVSNRDCRAPDARHVSGVAIMILLRHFMFASDFEHLMDLIDRYPEAAIEFSVFECCVGVLPMSNTIIWEVRNY